VLALSLLTLVVLVASPPPPLAAAAPPSSDVIRVLDWNIAGGAQGHGEVGKRPATVVEIVRESEPTIIALQETCYTQYLAIEAQIESLGYHAIHIPVHRSGSCHDRTYDNRWGNALFIKTDEPVTDSTRYALPWGRNPKGSFARQPRAMVCATTELDDREARICSVHTTPRDPDKRDQIDRVASILEPVVAQDTLTVLAGDFNSQIYPPKDLEFLQSGSRADTTDSGKHLDWVLATEPVEVIAIVPTNLSDHHLVLADVALPRLNP
jgi:endonuclease/exonuclease/phosphatase family metal-dependent hydrolase